MHLNLIRGTTWGASQKRRSKTTSFYFYPLQTLLALISTLIGVVNSQVATLDFSKTIFFEKMQPNSIFDLPIRLPVIFYQVFQHRNSLIYRLYRMIYLILNLSILVQVPSGYFLPFLSSNDIPAKLSYHPKI